MSLTPLALEVMVVVIGIFLLMLDAFFPKMEKRQIAWAALFGLAIVFIISLMTGPAPLVMERAGYYVMDPLAGFFKPFLILCTMLTIVLAMEYAPLYLRLIPSGAPGAGLGELFILPIFVCAGLMWMVSATDFIMIFVSLELLTIGFYVLVASMRRSGGSLEAGVKYLILGALSTGFLVYGITWLFGLTGQTNLAAIRHVLPQIPVEIHPPLLFGLGLVLVALGFKIAAAPFQFWVPDVYQGAPTPVTAFLSVASKAAGFVVLLRVIEPFLRIPAMSDKLHTIFLVLASATLLYGNLAAMPQTNLKRLLAYSSIAHAGYLLVAVTCLPSVLATRAIVFYLGGYLLMTYLSFLVVVMVSRVSASDDIVDFNGLGKRSPLLAAGMLISMLSLAGLPFTIGFLGKFFIFQAAVASHEYFLVVLGAITVACGFYYYLKVVRAMYWQPAPENAPPLPIAPFAGSLIVVLCGAILFFGIFPQPILSAYSSASADAPVIRKIR